MLCPNRPLRSPGAGGLARVGSPLDGHILRGDQNAMIYTTKNSVSESVLIDSIRRSYECCPNRHLVSVHTNAKFNPIPTSRYSCGNCQDFLVRKIASGATSETLSI